MIIFLYGEDTYRSRQKLKEIVDNFKAKVDVRGESLSVVDAQKATVAQLAEAAGAPSLFARKRMVVIEGLLLNKSDKVRDGAAEHFKRFAKDGADDNVIVFWEGQGADKIGKTKLYAFLSKQKFSQEFKPLSNTEATAWVKEEAKRRGGTITNEAALHLSGLFGSDLWQLSHEINKLVHYKAGRGGKLLVDAPGIAPIETRDVSELSRGQMDESIFALSDALSARNRARALELLERELRAGVAEGYLMTMIVRQFKILLQVRQALDLGQSNRKIMSALKLHPFVVQKAMNQVRNFSLERLKAILLELIAIDRQVKTGQADFKAAMGLLFARI
jgi:DNA polymerase-3 subunit delta